MLKNFLNKTYFEDYVPQVKHMIYPAVMMAVGYKSMLDYDWVLFGITFFILGILLSIVIILGIGWRGPIEYWSEVNSTIQTMLRVKDPAVWQALGFKEIPTVIEVKETKTDQAGNFMGEQEGRTGNCCLVVVSPERSRPTLL